MKEDNVTWLEELELTSPDTGPICVTSDWNAPHEKEAPSDMKLAAALDEIEDGD